MEWYFRTHDSKCLRGKAQADDCFIECYRNSLVANFGCLFLFASIFGVSAIHDSLLSFQALCITSCIGMLILSFASYELQLRKSVNNFIDRTPQKIFCAGTLQDKTSKTKLRILIVFCKLVCIYQLPYKVTLIFHLFCNFSVWNTRAVDFLNMVDWFPFDYAVFILRINFGVILRKMRLTFKEII